MTNTEKLVDPASDGLTLSIMQRRLGVEKFNFEGFFDGYD